MKSIWYFVGLLLTTLGTIITISALYSLVNPPAEQKVLANLHPDLWWGLFMLAFGLVFTLVNRHKTVH
jgi:hypothetical protein